MSTERKGDRKALARSIRDAIDKGTSTVEEIHKSIADLPLEILQKSDLLREPAKEVQRVQDYTIGAIYGLIRSINDRVGALASDLLADTTGRRGVREATTAKHHAA